MSLFRKEICKNEETRKEKKKEEETVGKEEKIIKNKNYKYE